MCFGGGDDSSSKKMIKMQKEEAAKAAAREAERQARIKSGLSNIQQMFHGKDVMKNVSKSLSTKGLSGEAGSSTGLPAGYKFVSVPNPVAAPKAATSSRNSGRLGSARDKAADSMSRGNSNDGRVGGNEGHMVRGNANNAASGSGSTMKIQGPDGKIYDIGDSVIYGDQEATGAKTGEWQKGFLDDYKQKILDYFTPQVAEQYGDARDETTYRLARAGTLQSDAGIQAAADLAKQNDIRVGEVASKADTAAGELQDRINKEETAATNLVYSTENPEVAAGQATRNIQNITAESPDLSPLGEIFNIATIGGANLAKGISNARSVGGYGSGSTLGRKQNVVNG